MPPRVLVRPAQPDDKESWLALWGGYYAELDGAVSDEATNGLWHRILVPDDPIRCLIASALGGKPLAFAHYVLHPHTFSLQTVCYLEDIFVTPTERGNGVGQALIERLIELGKQHGWRRIYWHTHEDNRNARALYDRMVHRTDYIRYDVDLSVKN